MTAPWWGLGGEGSRRRGRESGEDEKTRKQEREWHLKVWGWVGWLLGGGEKQLGRGLIPRVLELESHGLGSSCAFNHLCDFRTPVFNPQFPLVKWELVFSGCIVYSVWILRRDLQLGSFK